MKKSSSRSQRGSKGIKGKHVLQICVLLGVCIWLIYQVKYSHDKKKEFYEKDGEKSTVLLPEREDGLVKLGRKDLLPGYHNSKNEKEKHVEEAEDEEEKEGKSKVEEEKEEEEEVVEEDEEDKSKQGEEVAEDDEDESKPEEDEIDEQDQSKGEGDDELLEEEKERDEKEKDMTVAEAREEHYKADDASSAVSHESRVLSTEKIKESPGNSTELAQENNLNATTSEVEIQKELGLKLGVDVSGDVVEKTTTEVKDGESGSSNSDTNPAVTESRGETVNGNLTEAILEASGFLQNETEIMRARSQEDNAPPVGVSNLQTEQSHNESVSSITVPANITDNDSVQEESRNSTSESSLIENIPGSNTTEVKESSRSEGDAGSAEKEISNLNSTDQTEETDDTRERSLSEEEKEADDTPERSISEEEREALIDPQTLPDIRIEGNEEDEEEAIGAE